MTARAIAPGEYHRELLIPEQLAQLLMLWNAMQQKAARMVMEEAQRRTTARQTAERSVQ